MDAANLVKFDEEAFLRLIEKVKVQSMVETVFVFKTGVEVREIFQGERPVNLY